MIKEVRLSRKAEGNLLRVPAHIVKKLQGWIELVEEEGLEEAKKIPGFHDEPLRGQRKGQRSIRLSKAYRAIYVIKDDLVEFVFIEEVNKHEY